MPLPNFLIIGAAKAGTTTLYDWLRPHPQIFMPELKEPHFFAYDGQPGRYFQVKTFEDYRALFDGVTDETAIGEASTAYLYAPAAAPRIRDALPGVRLIVSLRDPVDRARSLYEMQLRNWDKNVGRSFLETLDANPKLRAGYHPFLKVYLEMFGPAVRIVLLEDIKGDAAGVLRSLFGFLGVDPGFRPDLSKISNVGGLPRSAWLHSLVRDPRMGRLGRRILPKPIYERVRRLRNANLRKRPMAAEERARALAYFRDDILRTQDLIGRDLSAWLRA
jgi:hypothetical protein